MKVSDVAAALDRIAPVRVAQSWDNVGLLIGDAESEVRRVLITIDVTASVVSEARSFKADLICAYHPPIWDGLKRVTASGPTAAVYDLIRSGIAVYAVHTSLDVVAGGVNDALAAAVGLTDAEPIGDFVDDPAGPHYKVVTFVPEAQVQSVAEALYQAGAGRIGRYSNCGFQTSGTGTFKPLAGSSPTIGTHGRIETVAEVRLETVVTSDRIRAVIAALRAAHPYETPAFDVLTHHDVEHRLGLGRIGPLAKPARLKGLLAKIARVTGAKAVGLVGPQDRMVRSAAVCAGSCGKVLHTVLNRACDLYVTGELQHHEALAAQEADLTVACLSHTVSERFALKNLMAQLKKAAPGLVLRQSLRDHDPFEWTAL